MLKNYWRLITENLLLRAKIFFHQQFEEKTMENSAKDKYKKQMTAETNFFNCIVGKVLNIDMKWNL